MVRRSFVVRVHWTDLPKGGHFLEWEVPDLVARDIDTFFANHR
jgi:pimeloyl-ACP methyl ester carboxylesterase